MRTARRRGLKTYVVVGQLCDSEREARGKLHALRQNGPNFYDWGLAKIVVGVGESPSTVSKIQLPPHPKLLRELKVLLSDRALRQTKAGKEAHAKLKAALGRRR